MTKHMTKRIGAHTLVLASVLLSAGLAQARQVPAETLRGLISKIVVGDRIQLMDKSRKLFEGNVDAMSATSLRLSVRGKDREFSESDIQEIRIHRPERKGDGALIGLAGGIVAGVLVTKAECPHDPECTANAGPAFVLLLGGAGIGVGEIIDVLTNKHNTIFRTSANNTGLQIRVSPQVSNKRKSVALAFTF